MPHDETPTANGPERPTMDVDIACVGFGPAMGGFLTTLARGLAGADGKPAPESAVSPGLPPQVVCYERAEGLGFGVSGVVTKARGIRASFPDLDPSQIPMAARVTEERVAYLLDPHGASRRSAALRMKLDQCLTGSRLAKDRAAQALSRVMIPEALDYPV